MKRTIRLALSIVMSITLSAALSGCSSDQPSAAAAVSQTAGMTGDQYRQAVHDALSGQSHVAMISDGTQSAGPGAASRMQSSDRVDLDSEGRVVARDLISPEGTYMYQVIAVDGRLFAAGT